MIVNIKPGRTLNARRPRLYVSYLKNASEVVVVYPKRLRYRLSNPKTTLRLQSKRIKKTCGKKKNHAHYGWFGIHQHNI